YIREDHRRRPTQLHSSRESCQLCSPLNYYKNGISEGEYTHTAHVELDEVLAPSGQTARRSAPSLMDLVHEENISPSAADQDALEDLLFNHPDPFDLAETDFDTAAPTIGRALPECMGFSGGAGCDPGRKHDDWSIDEFI
ncbi:hypothetical protein B0H14DRAFT_2659250, partial [Mycena olivaceomarginata]